jgi:probable aminopeptidase NPEPL1
MVFIFNNPLFWSACSKLKNKQKVHAILQFGCRMMTTQLKFRRGGLASTDPHTHPVTLIGQLEHLKTIGYHSIKAKFGERVTEEVKLIKIINYNLIRKLFIFLQHYNNSLAALSPSPTDSVSLYLNYANVVALPKTGSGSRHNAPSRPHCLAKVIKSAVSHAEEEGIVVHYYISYNINL